MLVSNEACRGRPRAAASGVQIIVIVEESPCQQGVHYEFSKHAIFHSHYCCHIYRIESRDAAPALNHLPGADGRPSDLNALNATALYVGVFAMMFAVERILLRVGYKRMLLGGLIVVTAAIVLFPLLHNIYVWFVLRMIVGLGTARCITRLSCGRSPSARLTGADGIFRCTGWPMDLASASVRSALICSACMIPHRSW